MTWWTDDISQLERYLLWCMTSNNVYSDFIFASGSEVGCLICGCLLFVMLPDGNWPNGSNAKVANHAREHFDELGVDKVNAALTMFSIHEDMRAEDVIVDIWGQNPPRELTTISQSTMDAIAERGFNVRRGPSAGVSIAHR